MGLFDCKHGREMGVCSLCAQEHQLWRQGRVAARNAEELERQGRQAAASQRALLEEQRKQTAATERAAAAAELASSEQALARRAASYLAAASAPAPDQQEHPDPPSTVDQQALDEARQDVESLGVAFDEGIWRRARSQHQRADFQRSAERKLRPSARWRIYEAQTAAAALRDRLAHLQTEAKELKGAVQRTESELASLSSRGRVARRERNDHSRRLATARRNLNDLHTELVQRGEQISACVDGIAATELELSDISGPIIGEASGPGGGVQAEFSREELGDEIRLLREVATELLQTHIDNSAHELKALVSRRFGATLADAADLVLVQQLDVDALTQHAATVEDVAETVLRELNERTVTLDELPAARDSVEWMLPFTALSLRPGMRVEGGALYVIDNPGDLSLSEVRLCSRSACSHPVVVTALNLEGMTRRQASGSGTWHLAYCSPHCAGLG